MTLRIFIVGAAWALMAFVAYLNVTGTETGGFNSYLWLAYLTILIAIILWPRKSADDQRGLETAK